MIYITGLGTDYKGKSFIIIYSWNFRHGIIENKFYFKFRKNNRLKNRFFIKFQTQKTKFCQIRDIYIIHYLLHKNNKHASIFAPKDLPALTYDSNLSR